VLPTKADLSQSTPPHHTRVIRRVMGDVGERVAVDQQGKKAPSGAPVLLRRWCGRAPQV
jgi:hypothetical protein